MPVVLIDWADTLHLERRHDGQLHRHDLGPALPPDDLCLRAARSLQQASGTTLGADISILKQVPWGAGMGGGSSDAATTLLGLNKLWGLNWPRARLQTLAAQLGADVPFFVGGRNAFVEGIGDILTPMPVPTQRFAVIKPPQAIATAAIFSSPLVTRNTKPAIVAGSLADTVCERNQQQSFEGLLGGFGRNDLQAAAEALCPEVTQARQWLAQRFGNSRMTGSGSAVFARVEETGTGGQPVATELEGTLPEGWVGRMCHSLLEHPLVGWAS
ncbi:MAG: 4-(cytidine 5'-diphospho)-2-C-methyl-D-erythritol kinase [Ideonella sp. MAG2]|nr:MAG: 4-(cytidine 5'-diphospho)-2-C-methyl-D-erythritol kinase [Ideonella sp. MAG2]